MRKLFLKAPSTIALALLGGGYFSAFSQLDLPMGLENYLILVPVQLGFLAYFLVFRKQSAHQLSIDSAREEEYSNPI
jgi:hypothetical protein